MAHLLVVDDEAAARGTLSLLLRKRGHRVLEADGVTAAGKRLAEEVFDLVVTDLRMPDGDGLDVLRAAKAHAPGTEVILLSSPPTRNGSRPRRRSAWAPSTTSRRARSPTSSTTASTRPWPAGPCAARTRT
jgi:response regulator RpfG family c-di-GMP phosphodiesterase